MDSIKVSTKDTTGGGRPTIESIEVASFTKPGLNYTVKLYEGESGFLGATCECGAYVHGSGCTKHVCEGRTRIHAERKGAPAHHAEYIHELCKRVFGKPRKDESVARSYDLLCEIYSYHYRTPELTAAVHARHDAVSRRFYGEEAA